MAMGDSLPSTENVSPPLPAVDQSKGDANAPKESAWHRISRHLRTEISPDHSDIPILACCLVSGLCDSSVYNAWTCFVSMQTGNTIFLALGASGQPVTHPYGWLKSLVSILTFLAGCFFFASSRHIGPRHRETLAGSFFIQGLCIVIAAALVQGGIVPEPSGVNAESGSSVHFIELLPLGFLAFQSGGQIVASRVLGFNEVPTTVLTSVYCDLISDPKVLAPLKDNVKRNRRVVAVLSFLVAAIAGGWLSRSKAGMSSALWIAAAIKLSIAVSWSFWKGRIALET